MRLKTRQGGVTVRNNAQITPESRHRHCGSAAGPLAVGPAHCCRSPRLPPPSLRGSLGAVSLHHELQIHRLAQGVRLAEQRLAWSLAAREAGKEAPLSSLVGRTLITQFKGARQPERQGSLPPPPGDKVYSLLTTYEVSNAGTSGRKNEHVNSNV